MATKGKSTTGAAGLSSGNHLTYTALLVGASGLVGSALLMQLIQDRRCKWITVIARHPMNAPIRNSGTKLNWIVTGFDHMDLALNGVEADVVFCALGTTMKQAKTREQFRKVDFTYPSRLAEWAKHKGAKVFLAISSMGASQQSPFFYSRVKGETEAKLAEYGLPELHLFRPSLLLGKRRDFRLAERIGAMLTKGLSWAWIGPFRRFKPIQGEEVARAMRAVAVKAVHNTRSNGNQTGRAEVRIYESDAIAFIAREMTG